MDPLRLDTLAAQVVAWHNRHPLARRITAAQVHSTGFVVLPGMQICLPRAEPAPVETAATEAAEAVKEPDATPFETPSETSFAADAALSVDDLAADAAPAADSAAVEVDEAKAPVATDAPLGAEPGAEADQAPVAATDDTQATAADAPQAAPEATADGAPDAALAAPSDAASDAAPDPAPDADPGLVPEAASDPDPDPSPLAEPTAALGEPETTAAEALPGASAHTDPGEPSPAAAPPSSLRQRLASRLLPAPNAAPVALPPAAADPVALHQPMQAEPPALQAAVQTAPGSAAPAHSQPWRLAFSEPFLERTPLQRVVQWAQQQAQVLAVRLPAAAPVRHVARDAALSRVQPGKSERPIELLLRTAMLEVGGHRQRLLVGAGIDPAVLGRRLWSLPRVALACLPMVLLPLTAGVAWWLGTQSAQQVAAAAQLRAAPPAADAPTPAAAHAAASGPIGPADAVSAPAVAADVASAQSVASAVGAVGAASAVGAVGAGNTASAVNAPAASQAFAAYTDQAASAAQAAAEAAVAAAQPPVDVEPRLGRVTLPPLGPLFADERFEPTRQRRLAERAARAAPAVAIADANPAAPAAGDAAAVAAAAKAPAAAVSVSATATGSPSASAQATVSPAPAAPVAVAAWALATRPLRTAAESELVQAAMRNLLAKSADPNAQVQRVPQGDDWRVLGGPFASRAVAEQTRALLQARGVRTEVLEIPPASATGPSAATATATATAAAPAAVSR